MALHPDIVRITARIRARSHVLRRRYLERCEAMQHVGVQRSALSCTNAAHVEAGMPKRSKVLLRQLRMPNIAIVNAYNDMLSAHKPYEAYPEILRAAVAEVGATAQVAAGVPAMCDGVTQGQPGMELSLFSRDVIAMATAIGLAHNAFDGVLLLGICDKIVPGLLIGALQFGHLPAIFVPAGPMSTGRSNYDKSLMRQYFAEGKISREELLVSESAAYHEAGTCTFYGTANSNQLLLEVMGLHLPGAAFVHPKSELRNLLTKAAARRICEITALGNSFVPISRIVDERAIVNAIVGLLASGGSTNHTIHLVAIARAAGILINWDDFEALARIVPVLARVYPNGKADVNDFQDAGGPGFLIRELLSAGLLHEDVMTILGRGLRRHARAAAIKKKGVLEFVALPRSSSNSEVLRKAGKPFAAEGGVRVLHGNLGRAVVKTSALSDHARRVRAACRVFTSQEEVLAAFEREELNRDCVVVVRFQGPRANGMPELHQLNSALGVVQDKGFAVAIVTDGRMSGASGKILSAIHCSPEALDQSPLSKLMDGDLILVDADAGRLEVELPAAELAAREPARAPHSLVEDTFGRALFEHCRRAVLSAEQGATILFSTPEISAAKAPAAPQKRRRRTATEEVLDTDLPS